MHHPTRFLARRGWTRSGSCATRIARPGRSPDLDAVHGVGFGGKTGVDWDAVGGRNPSGRVGTPEDVAGLAML